MVKIIFKEPLRFEWDKGNEEKNWIKHKVSPKEAEDVFHDKQRLLLEDIKHSSEKENRFILIGNTKKKRKLFIIFTIRNRNIRIISARDTNRKEEVLYEKAISAA